MAFEVAFGLVNSFLNLKLKAKALDARSSNPEFLGKIFSCPNKLDFSRFHIFLKFEKT